VGVVSVEWTADIAEHRSAAVSIAVSSARAFGADKMSRLMLSAATSVDSFVTYMMWFLEMFYRCNK
jgi:hypothetical protein